MDYDQIKESIGRFALQFVKPGMTIGLGSGTTSQAFIKALIAQKIPDIKCVATSKVTEELARSGNLTLITDFSEPFICDVSFDGADWVSSNLVSSNKQLIKGFGGALLREKIVAHASKKFFVMVDDRKLCENFDSKILPIEITPFAFGTTIKQIGLSGSIRKNFVTDNGNYIFDAKLPAKVDIIPLNRQILEIPGVIDTGLFTNSAIIVVGRQDGTVGIW